MSYNRDSNTVYLSFTFDCFQNAKTRLIVGNHLGIADVLTKTYRTDGARGLYKGFWPNMASIFVYTGIFLMTYEHVKQLQYDRMAAGAWLPVSHEWMVHSISAMCSSVVGMILCYPISRIITRLQIENGQYATLLIAIIELALLRMYSMS
jgi:hypothetical protein